MLELVGHLESHLLGLVFQFLAHFDLSIEAE